MDQAGGALIGIGILIFLVILIIKLALTILVFALGVVIMALIPCAVGWIAYKTYLALTNNEFEVNKSVIFPLLTVITGASLGCTFFLNVSPSVIFILLASGGSLIGSLAYPYIRRRQLIKKYREGEKYLIES
ncbi:hypothetical protein ACN4EE_18565 [Geminocystis sp. CENA526]|uniref:hypothetical protein n=1 Tax=Geminocystis sp. CENA526 TaxID=1355871 RepID=UPI003D6E33B4